MAAQAIVSPSTRAYALMKPLARKAGRRRRLCTSPFACPGPRLVGAAGVERDAADQVDGTQQLVVGHRLLGRLVRIGRGRRRRGGFLVVLLVVFLVDRLQLGGLVVLLVRRLFRRLVGRLLVRVGDRAAQVLLAEAGALLDRLDLGLLDLDVGLDALFLDRAARRREIQRGGEADRAAPGHLHDGLYRAFAERARAENDRAAMILQGAGHDLRRGGRA